MRIAKLLSAGAVAALAVAVGAAPAPAQTGSVKGQFILEGKAPELPPPLITKDQQACSGAPNQSLVVDPKTKGIANIFIWVKRIDEKDIPAEYRKPKKPTVEIDQKGCVFIPHCVFAQAGQTLVMLNSDPVAHNVHVKAVRGTEINDLVAPNDRQGVTRELKKPDLLPVPVQCDIHPWMNAHLLVLDHPYAAVTDEQGQFTIEGLPPGKYDFRVWHEGGGYVRSVKADDVEIKAGQTTDLGSQKIDVKDLTK